MREVKFRAWLPKQGRIYNWNEFYSIRRMIGGKISLSLSQPSGASFTVYDNFTLEAGVLHKGKIVIMQYTGLKDSSDPPKEIYEGDILKFTHIKGAKPFQIFWEENEARWTDYSPKTEVEIIGNIFENPELLDGKP